MGIDYAEHLRSDVASMVAAARRGPLDAPVESCPGWDLAALVAHMARVHRWAAAALTTGGAPDGSTLPRPPTDREALPGFLETAAAELLDAMDHADPGAPCWNFAGAEPAIAGWWFRRMAAETAVHRWDAQAVGGRPEPIDRALASDAVDELLSELAPYRVRDRPEVLLRGSVHLHCTDVEGEWTCRTDDTGLVVDRGHAKGDAALRGPASAILLILWRRFAPGDGGTEVFGDRAVLDELLELLR
jgi:uncharacterized protein (TIGR03083 family)